MNVEQLEMLTRTSRAAIARARATNQALEEAVPYYGYVDVDMFDCPPFVMFTNNDAPVVDYILKYGTFEPQSMKLWCALSRTATGILDIGANIGIYSLCAALIRPDVQVNAFEPNPYAFARLRMHKTLNNAGNLYELTAAVGPRTEIVPFGWFIKAPGHISSGGGVGFTERADIEKTVVQMVKLDGSGMAAVLGDKPLVKMDVEGGERSAFEGMSEILALKPDIILETFSEEACAYINDRMMPLGYSVYKILESERRLVAQDRLKPCAFEGHDFNQFLTTRPLPAL